MQVEVKTMRDRYGYLSASDAYALLQAGLPIYIVSAPPETNALPLDGGWVDDDGNIHYDCSAVVLNPETAMAIGRAFRQQCIMRVYPCHNGNAEVYLMPDTEFNRQVALKYCGGYTADGKWLVAAVDAEKSVFLPEYAEYTLADVEFIPCK